ncbi:hypothetical protein LJC33_00220 [Eubacteriales bacterium OttesenSCG-928-N13]|nr:hypothetical protein [Eubacteriales bacterium OttesenSCG-928-N13]
MADEGLVLPFEEVAPVLGAWKTIQVERLPFISYPYEWSFHQLKDAALLTLRLQKDALKSGLILKDASAYNIQFVGKRPVFIDLLSFETWQEGTLWGAYKQFCTHFLAPLALMANVDLRCGSLSQLWIDGIPLDVAAKMMPRKAKWNPGLNFHLFTHARLQDKYSDSGNQYAAKVKGAKVTREYLIGLAESLERLLAGKALSLPKVTTEWGDYYSKTNYSEKSADEKYTIVEALARKYAGGGLTMDLGANTGRYTQAIASHSGYVLASDIDPLAVDRHYTVLKGAEGYGNILPILIDFANPSPGIGFGNEERPSFKSRCRCSFIIALAVIHHLHITAGIPLALLSGFFAGLLDKDGILVLEFVPKEDSQVKKLLALREDIFEDYTLDRTIEIFGQEFECVDKTDVPDSCRHILTLKKR